MPNMITRYVKIKHKMYQIWQVDIISIELLRAESIAVKEMKLQIKIAQVDMFFTAFVGVIIVE